jgi:hypothetical protein
LEGHVLSMLPRRPLYPFAKLEAARNSAVCGAQAIE